MKRSEMLKALAELIHDNHSIFEDGLFLGRRDVIRILEGLEEKGMLPPDDHLWDKE